MATSPEMNIEAASPDRAAQLRKQMVDDLVAEGTIVSAPVEVAMHKVHRELFAPDANLEEVYQLYNGVVTKWDGDGNSISSVSAPTVRSGHHGRHRRGRQRPGQPPARGGRVHAGECRARRRRRRCTRACPQHASPTRRNWSGVHAFGPDASKLAEEVAELLRLWGREHRGELGPQFRVYPVDTPNDQLSEGRVVQATNARITPAGL